jgi:hypothetical protein
MIWTPTEFLVAMLLITAIAGTIQVVRRRRRVRALRALGEQWRMHFSVHDRFHLASRVAARLSAVGAASVRIVDLLYAIERENYRYVFTTEYTLGVLRGRTGVWRVGTLAEPRDGQAVTIATAGHTPETGAAMALQFAPQSLSLIEQYRHLLAKCEAR